METTKEEWIDGCGVNDCFVVGLLEGRFVEENDGDRDCTVVCSYVVGLPVGGNAGDAEGFCVCSNDGPTEAFSDGFDVGSKVVGASLGVTVCLLVGDVEGSIDDSIDGNVLGLIVGAELGTTDGDREGDELGLLVVRYEGSKDC